MTNPLGQLEDLAAAAEAHAAREHGASIGLEDAAAADRVLEAEAKHPDPARLGSIAACYGAWIGRLAVRRWNAEWIGLSEPAAPRIRIAGVVASPIDAVRRRLLDAASPSLEEIGRRFESWAKPERAAVSANRDAWDRLADDARFAGAVELPPDPETALDDWVRAEGVRGKRVLCLGAGGGRQGPLLARAGASVTVVDFSERQLDHDRRAAEKHQLDLRAVCAPLDDLRSLADGAFDLVIQPVSSCYVADLGRPHAELARVLRSGGLYVAQHKQPAALQAGDDLRLTISAVEGAALPASTAAHREPGTTEYLHTLETLLGGLCRAGFVIEDVTEPPRGDALAPEGSPEYRAGFLPPYLKVKARRR